MRNFYFGLDLGHYECKLTILEELPDNKLIAYNNSLRHSFLSKGEILDLETLAEIIERLLEEVASSFNLNKIEALNVCFSTPFFQSSIQKGYVIFDKNITDDDIAKAIRIAKTSTLLVNQVNLIEEPIKFLIDGTQEVRDPLGLSGRRLDVEVFFINIHKSLIDKLNLLFNGLKLKVANFLPTLYPASKVCLSKKDKEIGIALMDVGAQTTIIGVFAEGKLVDFRAFDIGGDYLTQEIALHFRLEPEEAENLKREALIEIDKKQKKKSKLSLLKFIEKKIREGFNERKVVDYLKEIKKKYKLPGGLVIIGGGAKIMNFDNFLKNLFNMQIRYPKDELNIFNDQEELIKYANSAGSALMLKYRDERETLWGKIKNLFIKPFIGY